jgi:MraZ protein
MSIFTNKYTVLLDEKNRCVLPASFKKELGDDQKLVIERDAFKKCLNLYPVAEWQNRVKKIRKKFTHDDPRQSDYLSRYFEEIVTVTLSEIGRITFPKEMIEYAGIKKEMLFAGQGTLIKVWNSDSHAQARMNDEEFAEMTKKILGSESDFFLLEEL